MTDTTYTPEDLTALTDQLLLNITEHLRKEFAQGRISGTDYAMVYTSSIQSAMQQAHQFLLQKDIAGYQADITYEQKLQAVNGTVVSGEQVTQATQQTILVTNNTEVSSATKQNQIDASIEQLDQLTTQGTILDEQEKMALNQTEVSDGTKANQILMVQTQLDTADEQLTVLRERHGINLTPEYS